MAKSRWQEGTLLNEGGRWKVRYRVDEIVEGPEGPKLERKLGPRVELGPATGPAAMTRTEAKRRMREVMAAVDAGGLTPQSLLTVAEFVAERFLPEYVPALRPGGQKHYRSMLKHVVRRFGAYRLRDLNRGHVKRILAELAAVYSRETVTKVRNTLGTVFNYARDAGCFTGDNPASRVKVPECAKPPKAINAYTREEARRILSLLDSPLREMALLSMTTSMHASELAGLRVEHLNMSAEPRTIAGEVVASWSLYVCESVYLNKRSSNPKNRRRRRVLPIPQELQRALGEMVAGREGWMPVFVMPRTLKMASKTGKIKPVDPHNITNRIFKPLGEALGFAVNWHRFRHTHATLTDYLGLEEADRLKLMGQTSSATLERYTHAHERQRAAAEKVFTMLTESVQ